MVEQQQQQLASSDHHSSNPPRYYYSNTTNTTTTGGGWWKIFIGKTLVMIVWIMAIYGLNELAKDLKTIPSFINPSESSRKLPTTTTTTSSKLEYHYNNNININSNMSPELLLLQEGPTTINNLKSNDDSNNSSSFAKGSRSKSSPPPPSIIATTTTKTTRFMPENPTNLRVLVAIPMYNLKQYPLFEKCLDSLIDLCFYPQMHTLHIVIYTTTTAAIHSTPIIQQEMDDRTKTCQKQLNFTLDIQQRPPSIGVFLVDEHRYLFLEQQNNYDLFVYNEEDNNIRPKHIFGYWRETARLYNNLPSDKFEDYSIGFLRYEEPPWQQQEFDQQSSTTLLPRYVFEFSRTFNTERDTKSPKEFAKKHLITELIPYTGSYYYNGASTFHQGMYMATSIQLEKWKERSSSSCHFKDPSKMVGGCDPGTGGYCLHREEVSSINLFSPRGCNVTQLLPVDSYQDFLIHHLSNKYWNQKGYKIRRIPTTKLGSILTAAVHFLEEQAKKEDMDMIKNKPKEEEEQKESLSSG